MLYGNNRIINLSQSEALRLVTASGVEMSSLELGQLMNKLASYYEVEEDMPQGKSFDFDTKGAQALLAAEIEKIKAQREADRRASYIQYWKDRLDSEEKEAKALIDRQYRDAVRQDRAERAWKERMASAVRHADFQKRANEREARESHKKEVISSVLAQLA